MKHPKQYNTTEAISKRMSHVHLKKGKAETLLAKALWHDGYRYRLNYSKLPGSPDIALTKYHVVIFVDGEFWHGYDWKNRKGRIKSNREYWIDKIEENIARDKRNDECLIQSGWLPLHYWEKDVLRHINKCVSQIESILTSWS